MAVVGTFASLPKVDQFLTTSLSSSMIRSGFLMEKFLANPSNCLRPCRKLSPKHGNRYFIDAKAIYGANILVLVVEEAFDLKLFFTYG